MAVLIIFLVILQTDINVIMLSIGGHKLKKNSSMAEMIECNKYNS